MKKHVRPDGDFLELTQEEWDEQYPLVPNHFQPNEGNRFETLGAEAKFVKQQDPAKVWTLIDDGEAGEAIVSGYQFVNRLGYYVSTRPRPDDTYIVVSLEDDEEGSEEDSRDEYLVRINWRTSVASGVFARRVQAKDEEEAEEIVREMYESCDSDELIGEDFDDEPEVELVE